MLHSYQAHVEPRPRVSRSRFLLGGACSMGMLLAHSVAGAQAQAVVHVGSTGIEAQAQAVYAQELGLFKRAGIDIDAQITRGGAATVAGVAGGSLQIGCANVISLGQALQRGLPFVILAGATIWDSKAPNAYAAVAPNSPIRSARDIENQVIGATSLGSIEQLVMEAWIKKSGGDPDTNKWVEIPDALSVEALNQGRIAIKLIEEPMFSAAGNRVRAIGQPGDGIAPRFAQTVWFATAAWLKDNKSVARTFISAITEAGKWVMSHRPEASAILERRLGLVNARSTVNFASATNVQLIQTVFDSAVTFKMLQPLNAVQYIWNGT